MKKQSKLIALLLVLSMLLPGMAQVVKADSPAKNDLTVTRIYGKTRVGTSIEASKEAFEDGSAKNVVLAGYSGEVDALAGTLLAKAKNAPLLLASENELEATKAELIRLGTENIYVLGGSAVVSDEIVNKLKKEDYTVERIKGRNREETAVAVAKEVKGQTKHVFLAKGYGELADALAIGPVSAKKDMPILLTDKNNVNDVTLKALEDLGVERVTIVGGPGAVTEVVENQLGDVTVDRVYGTNRLNTALEIAGKYFDNPENAVIASGYKFADALVGGYLGAMKDAPILLANVNNIDASTVTYLESGINHAYILGGTGVISSDVETKVKEAVEVKVELEVKSVSVIDATTIEVTFDNEEVVEIELEEALAHGENEVTFTYEDQEFTVTVEYVDPAVVAREEAVEAYNEAVAAAAEAEVDVEDLKVEDVEEATTEELVAAAEAINNKVEETANLADATEAVEAYEAEVKSAANVVTLVENKESLNKVSEMKTPAFNKVQKVTGEEKDALLDRLDVAHDRVIAATVVRALQDATEDLTEDNLDFAKNKLSSANRVPKLVEDQATEDALMALVVIEEAKINEMVAVIEAVEAAEETETKEDVDAAKELVEALEEGEVQEGFEARLDAVQAKIDTVTAVNEADSQLKLHAALKDFDGYDDELIQDYVTEKTGKTYTSVKDIQENLVDKVNKAAEDKTDAEAFRAELLAEAKKSDVALYNYLKGLTDTTELDNVDAYKTEMFTFTGEVVTDFKIALENEGSIKEAADVVELINYVNAEEAVEALFANTDVLADKVEQKDIDAAQELVDRLTGQIEDSEADGYNDDKKDLQDGIDEAQELLDVRVATKAVNELFATDAKEALAEGVGQKEIDAAKDLVDALEDENDAKEGLLLNVAKAQALEPLTAALAAVNGMIRENDFENQLEILKNEELGLDFDKFNELDSTTGQTGGRQMAVIYDIISNKPEEDGYTKETLKLIFDEIVETRLVFEESVELYATAIGEDADPLTDITYITMLIDQLESVSYEIHSNKSIKEERLPELQELVDRFNALEGEEVILNDDVKATDAQKAVLVTINYEEADKNSSTRTRNKLKTALITIENLIVEQARPEGFEVVEADAGKVTAGEEVTFTINAYKTVEGENIAFEKFNKTYKDVKIELNNVDGTFFYRTVEFVNGVATVTVPVTDATVTSITIEKDAFKVEDEVDVHDALIVTVDVSPAELDEVKYAFDKPDDKKITFTAVDAFENEIKMFKKGNVRVQLPAGVKSKTPASDATGLVLVNVVDEDGTAEISIELTEALGAGTYTFTVGGEEVVIVIPEADEA